MVKQHTVHITNGAEKKMLKGKIKLKCTCTQNIKAILINLRVGKRCENNFFPFLIK